MPSPSNAANTQRWDVMEQLPDGSWAIWRDFADKQEALDDLAFTREEYPHRNYRLRVVTSFEEYLDV